MKKMIATLLTLSMLISAASGCAGKKSTDKTSWITMQDQQAGNLVSSEIDELRRAYSEFVFGVMKRCAEQADGTNVMISSDSLLLALEMAAAGAEGDTLKNIQDILVPGVGSEKALQFALDRMSSLRSDKLKIANSIWINQKFAPAVREEYINYVKEHFDAEAEALPFDKNAVSTINSWVNEKTDGMIPQLINDLDDKSDLMVLINAIAFESKWETGIAEESVYEETFCGTDGTETDTTFLHSNENIYISSDKAAGFIKPYEGGKYGFMAILPSDSEKDINAFMAELSAEDYWELWTSQTNKYKVHTSFPEFKSDYSKHMVEILQDMGMLSPFSGGADFSKMSESSASITEVIHKTHIEVDREGTKAAAATAIHMTLSLSVKETNVRYVRCDRPFAYAIVDMDTGLPVFLGTVASVN